MNRLIEMDAFVQVVKNRNFVAAASELQVSPGLVTRRVQTLESELGVKLLSRTTRRLSLTEAGERYYGFCQRVLSEVQREEAELRALQDAPVGRLKVVAPMSFGIMEMGKTVSAFMQAYPDIQVTLIIGDSVRRAFDPGEYEADLAIRFAQPRDSSLHVRKLGTMQWIVCAAPAYLKRMGTPKTPADLARHSCLVTSTHFGDGVWKFSGPGGPQKIEVAGAVSPSSAISMRYMVLDGVGVALLPAFCVAEDIRDGRLTPLLGDYAIAPQTISAIYPHGRQQPRKMHLLLDFLAARFKAALWASRA